MSLENKEDPDALYELVQKVGEGSYGSVWKGKFKTNISSQGTTTMAGAAGGSNGNGYNPEFCAIKIVPINGDISELKREIDFLKRSQSEYVISYYGSYIRGRYIWIAMELCEAGSICDLMHICHAKLDEPIIRTICASVLLGLNYLHDMKIIHRDIKAGNILLTENGQVKLADFGVSAQLTTYNAKRRTLIGTPLWMAPEIIQEVQYDGKADIWSLGITVIELAEVDPPLSNVHPMRAIFMIPSRPPPKFKEPSKWSPLMNDFLAACLVKDPEQRSTSKALLSHPFVQQTVNEVENSKPLKGASPLLKSLYEQHYQTINEYRQELLQVTIMPHRPGSTIQDTTPVDILETMDSSYPSPPKRKDKTQQSETLMINNSMFIGEKALLESEAEDEFEINATQAIDYKTQAPAPAPSAPSATATSPNGEPSATTKTPAAAATRNARPSFMSYFMTLSEQVGKMAMGSSDQSKSSNNPAKVDQTKQNQKRELTPEDYQKIRARMQFLDNQYKADFRELRRQHEARRSALLDVAGKVEGSSSTSPVPKNR